MTGFFYRRVRREETRARDRERGLEAAPSCRLERLSRASTASMAKPKTFSRMPAAAAALVSLDFVFRSMNPPKNTLFLARWLGINCTLNHVSAVRNRGSEQYYYAFNVVIVRTISISPLYAARPQSALMGLQPRSGEDRLPPELRTASANPTRVYSSEAWCSKLGTGLAASFNVAEPCAVL